MVSATIGHLDGVLDLLKVLVQRPRHGERDLPLLCLVRDKTDEGLLMEVSRYFGKVPHYRHEFSADEEAESAYAPRTPTGPVDYPEVRLVAGALTKIAVALSRGGGRRRKRIRFSRFELATWLMHHQQIGGNPFEREKKLALSLRNYERSRWRPHSPADDTDKVLADAPFWVRLILRVIPVLWWGLRPRISKKYRWFRRQANLAPFDPGTFLGFALRLTGWLGKNPRPPGDRDESYEQLLVLLVNAFLEDARLAYRRRWWRPRAARRTTYLAVLLDRITRRNGGYRLLELVNRIRNETGLSDPILFISGSRYVPPDAVQADSAPEPGSTPDEESSAPLVAYEGWCEQLRTDTRLRRHAAWYLTIRAQPGTVTAPHAALIAPAVPWWSRAFVRPAAFLAVLALVAGYVKWQQDLGDQELAEFRARHCGLHSDDAAARHLVTIDGECIGVTATSLPIHGQPKDLDDVQDMITSQNARAERLHEIHPERAFVSIAYVSEMSPVGEIQASEIERLQGVAARQRRQLDGNVADPLVRVLFVNAGHEMRHGRLAARLLSTWMISDRTFVGAMGLAVSSHATVETIKALGAAGIPMVASPLTADGLHLESPLYFQASPTNQREAQVAAKYARNQLGHTGPVTVVTSGNPRDLYDSTLAADAMKEFAAEGFTVDRRPYVATTVGRQQDADPREVGQQLCDDGGLVFYTGRPAEFGQLLEGINGTCGSAPPRILTGDDISRYVADPDSRGRFEIPYDHLALAVGGQTCSSGGDLNTTLMQLFEDWCNRSPESFLTDDASTTYDAVSVIISAVNMLRGTAASPGAVWHMITRITGSARIDGASGVIDFGSEGAQIPLDKFVAIMRVSGGGAPTLQATCGHYRDVPPADWCP
jgi:ABC-type branched-subunit amino acid transport system substrate-binding protein